MSAITGFLPPTNPRVVSAFNRAQAAYDRQIPEESYEEMRRTAWLDTVGYSGAIGPEEIDQILCDMAEGKPFDKIMKRFDAAVEAGWQKRWAEINED